MHIDKDACWNLLKNHYASFTAKDQKKQEKLEKKKKQKLTHAGSVADLCRKITGSLDPLLRDCVDVQLLEAAAILHDFAKLDKTDSHEKAAVLLIRQECAKQSPSPIDPAAFFALNEIISAHKGRFDPHPRYALEAAVLRMADKVDKLMRDRDEDAVESYEKSLKAIKKYCGRLSGMMEDACRKGLSES